MGLPEIQCIQATWRYRLVGMDEKAREVAQAFLRENRSGIRIRLWKPFFNRPDHLEEYCWLARTYGDPLDALEKIELRPFKSPGIPRDDLDQWTRSILLIELCRIHAQRKEWEKSEAAIDTLFAHLDFAKLRLGDEYKHSDFCVYQTASVLKGFLCERRGAQEAAQNAWRQGTRIEFLKRLTPRQQKDMPRPDEGEGDRYEEMLRGPARRFGGARIREAIHGFAVRLQ